MTTIPQSSLAHSGALHVRAVMPDDKNGWQALWLAYNRFYNAEVPADVTEGTWQRINGGHSAMGCIVAEDGIKLLGFINYVIHPRTWNLQDACYLEDLYVDDQARGRGIGRQLCESLRQICLAKGVSRIYWNTQESNVTARRLYDQIAQKDDFVRYVMPISPA